MANSKSLNQYEHPSKLGFSYQDVRSMSDEQIIKAGLDSSDRLAAELANRFDLALERERSRARPKPGPFCAVCDHLKEIHELGPSSHPFTPKKCCGAFPACDCGET